MPIRILHITASADGGNAVVVANLATNLNRAKYEPVVLFDTGRGSNVIESLRKSGLHVIRLKDSKRSDSFQIAKPEQPRTVGLWIKGLFGELVLDLYLSSKDFAVFVLKQLPRIRLFINTIRRNKIDLVHIHGDLHYSKPEIIAAFLEGIPCVLHVHMYQKLTAFDRAFKSLVSHFIYISTDIARFNYRQGLPQENASVIHNGVETERFTLPYDTDAVKTEFHVGPNDYLIGVIGRIDWWKGQDYFIRAVAQVTKKIPNLKALIVGALEETANVYRNKKYLESLQALIKSLHMEGTVFFTGARADVPRLMVAMDVVVHASSEPEPFGLVVLEGMAAGKPVVATAAGGVIDIIEDRITGLLVPPKDDEAMAAAIHELLVDKQFAHTLSVAAREKVISNFTIERQSDIVRDIYNALLDP